jgi:hypothetical protein
VTLKEINWCPYTKLTEGDVYDSAATYYIDSGHYTFDKYTWTNTKKFNADVLSGILYRDDGHGGRVNGAFSSLITNVNDTAKTILEELNSNSTNFSDAASSALRPQITGIIYINNTNAIEESKVADLQALYPNLTFFFANVTKAYSAKFIMYNEEDFSYTYVKHANGSTAPSVQKISATDYAENNNIFFTSPYEATAEDGTKTGYKPEKTHYDFKGWCLLNDDGTMDKEHIITEDAWSDLRITPTQYDYTYCAVFDVHKYKLSFWNADGSLIGGKPVEVPYGQKATGPNDIPYKEYTDDSLEGLYKAYNFKGYSISSSGEVVNLNEITVISDRNFYAIFEEVDDIRKVVHLDWFEAQTETYTYDEKGFIPTSSFKASGVMLQPKGTNEGNPIKLKGKITIPRKFNNKDVIALIDFSASNK